MNEMIKKNWFISLLVVLFAVISVYYIYDSNKGKLKGKSSNGEDVVYSINDQDVTASQYYDDLYTSGGTAALYASLSRAIASQSYETTDEMKTLAESQASSIVENYASQYSTNYREMLDSQLQQLGYSGYDDLTTYLIDAQKQQMIAADYAEANFDELNIRNVSYILIQFATESNRVAQANENEQERMDAVDAALNSGTSFADAAAEFSEDSSTASKGGVLGTLDKDTTSLDEAFLSASLKLSEGEISDWVYSENFGFFKIMCNASTPETLIKAYAEQQGTEEAEKIDAYSTLINTYDSSIISKAVWSKGEELGMEFANEEDRANVRSYMGLPAEDAGN